MASHLVQHGVLRNRGLQVDPKATWRDIVLGQRTLSFKRPLLIDLGGIAKSYAVDRALHTAAAASSMTVNAGGDLHMTHWQGQQVQVRPDVRQRGQGVCIPMQQAAIATSAYQRVGRSSAIISPHRGTIE